MSMERPASLTRGVTKEDVDLVREQVDALGKLVKKLSTDGSELKAVLEQSQAAGSVRPRVRRSSWDPMRQMPMSELVAKAHRAPKEEAPMDESQLGPAVTFSAPQEALAHKTMREIMEEEERARAEAAAEARATLASNGSQRRSVEDAGAASSKRRTAEASATVLHDARPAVKRLSDRASQGRKSASSRRGALPAVVNKKALADAVRLQSGDEWAQRVLPLLEGVLNSLSGRDADEPSGSVEGLARMGPCAAYLALHDLMLREEDEPPLARGPHETPANAAARARAQQDGPVAAHILPRAGCESEAEFRQRLAVFAPKSARGARKVKPSLATLVLPKQPHEAPRDFELRMECQASTAFVVLPRMPGEAHADFLGRLEAISASRMLWAAESSESVRRAPRPLLMPRGRHESLEMYGQRLDAASAPPTDGDGDSGAYCAVYLPQAADEPDELAALRFASQAAEPESLAPFNPRLETLDTFEARMQP